MNTTLSAKASVTTLLFLVACSSSDDASGSATDRSDARDAVTASAPLEWTAPSTGGSLVRVSADSLPVRPGELWIRVSVVGGSDSRPRSVDLVSPTMPAHGVVRAPVEAVDGLAVARLDIPMEGTWTIYVNLNEDGTDAAEFRFEASVWSSSSR